MPHWSHRSAKVLAAGSPETEAGGDVDRWTLPRASDAAITLLAVLADAGDEVLTVGGAGHTLTALAPLLDVKVRVAPRDDAQALWAAIDVRTRAVVARAEDDEIRALLAETDAAVVIEGETNEPLMAHELALEGRAIRCSPDAPAALRHRLAGVTRRLGATE